MLIAFKSFLMTNSYSTHKQEFQQSTINSFHIKTMFFSRIYKKPSKHGTKTQNIIIFGKGGDMGHGYGKRQVHEM